MQPKTMLERFSDWINGEDLAAPEPTEAPAHTVESILAECRRLWPDVEWEIRAQGDIAEVVTAAGYHNAKMRPSGALVAACWGEVTAAGPSVREAALAAMAAEATEQSRRACAIMAAVARSQATAAELVTDARGHQARSATLAAGIAALSGRA